MGPRLSKNILEIQQIESGTLAKFWSDGRNVAKVIANLVQPFCQKQALEISLSAIYTAQNKYDYMSLYAFFYYADLYIIVEYGIFLKKIQFPVQ